MTKFKVGDKVKLKDDLVIGEVYNGLRLLPKMKNIEGKIGTVKSINKRYGVYTIDIDKYNFNYSAGMLEKVVDNEHKDLTYVPERLDENNYWKCDDDPTLYDKFIKGEYNMTNEVLELWRIKKINKEKEKIKERYEKKYNSLDIVKEFNVINDKYISEMDELVTKYGNDLIKVNMCDSYVLQISSINEYYGIEPGYATEGIDKINNVYEEVKAQLSLSNDLEYVRKILMNYGIINKNGKINV